MPFTGDDAERFASIHQLLITQNLSVMPGPFNSQADIFKAYRQSAEIMTRTIPHEAGHAIVGLALGAGDVLEWIAVYNVSGGSVGGGCKWGEKSCPREHQWMSSAAGMGAEMVKYGDYFAMMAQLDKDDLARAGFDLTKQLPEYLNKCRAIIRSHEVAWNALQQLLYERTVKDLTDRVDAIRRGDVVDVGVVAGHEARDIFAGNTFAEHQ